MEYSVLVAAHRRKIIDSPILLSFDDGVPISEHGRYKWENNRLGCIRRESCSVSYASLRNCN
jgi:hypothetical protein